jgi:hypothetical protein
MLIELGAALRSGSSLSEKGASLDSGRSRAGMSCRLIDRQTVAWHPWWLAG